jgi:hypothetical protein
MSYRVRAAVVSLALVTGLTTALAAQTGSRPTCDGPEYRQFDFWIGSWRVVDQHAPGGGSAGARNHISAINDGCAILEEYTSDGFSGSSISYYDRRSGTWHQVWIDNQGKPLVQEGKFENGAMVLHSTMPDGSPSRLTWTANADGSVRQLWEKTTDGGTTWTVVFDGLYTKIADGM